MSESVLAVIPARGGSKGLPKKNVLPVAGYPLMAHTVFCAKMAPSIDRIVVSTDDDFIAQVARQYGVEVPFMRPHELATDDAPSWPVVQHALEASEDYFDETYDMILKLQPTSPARLPEDIESGIEKLQHDQTADGVIGVGEPDFHIGWQAVSEEDGRVSHVFEEGLTVTRRQDAEEMLYINGALYVYRRQFVLENDTWRNGDLLGEEIPRHRSIDIDTPHDYEEAQLKIRSGFLDLPWIDNDDKDPEDLEDIPPVRLEERLIGPNLPCFVIAEAGVNHNGEVEKAYQLIDEAAEAGADAVKFQTFVPEKIASPEAQKADYQVENTGDDNSQLEMLQELVLGEDVHRQLKQYAEQKGLVFLSTPYDADSVDLLENLDVEAYKTASAELTNHPLLAKIAGKGKPMLVSTGMATLEEIREALEVIERNGDPEVALFHCVSDYPSNVEDSNLRAIDTIRESFRLPVGWSDHTRGSVSAVASIARRACVIEKHFTLDKDLPGPDHEASLEPEQLDELVDRIRRAESAMGHGQKFPTDEEKANAEVMRKSICLARPVDEGEVLTDEDIAILRPGTGIAPKNRASVLGSRLRQTYPKGTPIQEQMLADDT